MSVCVCNFTVLRCARMLGGGGGGGGYSVFDFVQYLFVGERDRKSDGKSKGESDR